MFWSNSTWHCVPSLQREVLRKPFTMEAFSHTLWIWVTFLVYLWKLPFYTPFKKFPLKPPFSCHNALRSSKCINVSTTWQTEKRWKTRFDTWRKTCIKAQGLILNEGFCSVINCVKRSSVGGDKVTLQT